MRYLLDTNVISELVKNDPNGRVVAWVDDLEPDSTYLSVLTIGEISKGIERLPLSSRRERFTNWLHDFLLIRFSDSILGVDVDLMLTWSKMITRMEAAGKPTNVIDSIIAATALHYHCTLATRNVKHFLSTGITVLNPWD